MRRRRGILERWLDAVGRTPNLKTGRPSFELTLFSEGEQQEREDAKALRAAQAAVVAAAEQARYNRRAEAEVRGRIYGDDLGAMAVFDHQGRDPLPTPLEEQDAYRAAYTNGRGEDLTLANALALSRAEGARAAGRETRMGPPTGWPSIEYPWSTS